MNETILQSVLAFLAQKNGSAPTVRDAARGILANVETPTFLIQAKTYDFLLRWSTEGLTSNEIASPERVAAVLLWSDTWSRGA